MVDTSGYFEKWHFELVPVNEETGELDFDSEDFQENVEQNPEDMEAAEYAIYQQRQLEETDEPTETYDFDADVENEFDFADDNEEDFAIDNAQEAYDDLLDEVDDDESAYNTGTGSGISLGGTAKKLLKGALSNVHSALSHKEKSYSRRRQYKYAAYGCITFLVISIIIFACCCKKIKLLIAILKAAADFITDIYSVIVVPPVFYCILIGWFLWWVGTLLFIYTSGHLDTKGMKGYPFAVYKLTTW